MSEHSIAKAWASVMLYNNERKGWEHSGGSSGISRVHVYHHPINNTYRIVGRKVQDHAVVINCALAKRLKYFELTPTFHQWRDQRQAYGLKFRSKEDAQVFGHAVFSALENLKGMAPQPQPIIQQQHYAPSSHMSNGRNEPEEIPSHHRDQPQYDAYDQYSRGRVPSAGPERTYHNQYDMQRDRQSPIPSAVSLSTSPGPQPVVTQSTAPPAPPAPPGGPPAPPPPPAVQSRGGGSLADQIAAAKLKKASKAENEGFRSDRANSASRGGGKNMGGGMDMMAEMARKLVARKAKEEGRHVEPIKEEERPERTGPRISTSNPPSTPAFGNSNSKANFLTPASF